MLRILAAASEARTMRAGFGDRGETTMARKLWRLAALVLAAAALAVPAGAQAAERGAGTIKLDELVFDATPENDPHVQALFALKFYGFDLSPATVATVTFELQPPTGRGVILTDVVPLAGPEVDPDTHLDAVRPYFLPPVLAAFAPHPSQGWHLHVTVDVADASGPVATKEKSFWARPCADPLCSILPG
jgi:hypothetical protein